MALAAGVHSCLLGSIFCYLPGEFVPGIVEYFNGWYFAVFFSGSTGNAFCY